MRLGRVVVSPPHRAGWWPFRGVCVEWPRRYRPGDPTWTDLAGRTHRVSLRHFVRIDVQ